MTLKSKLLENWRSGIVGVTLTIVLGLGFLIFGIGEWLTNLSYDIPFAFRSTIRPTEVVIVYMDEESHTFLGQQPRFDLWDRALHARLLDRLREYGAKAVVFDVLFDTTNNPTADHELVRAVKAHGKVAVSAIVDELRSNHRSYGTTPVRPFDELREAVAAWGMVETGDTDVIRQHYGGELNVPSLNWKVAELTMTRPPDPAQRRWVNYYGPPGTIPSESYYKVISNAVPPEVFSNKVVYVGALFSVGFTGGKTSDDFKTPYTLWGPVHKKSPGVEINATTYLNLFRGDWLCRPSPVTEVCAVTLFGALAGWGLTLLRPLSAAGIGVVLMALVALLEGQMVWRLHVWYPWLVLCVVQIPCAVICAALFNTQRVYHEKQQLEESLATSTARRSAPVIAPVPGEPHTAEVLQELIRLRSTPAHGAPMLLASMGADGAPPAVLDHQLLQFVGKGAYGQVWLARNVMGSYRAVKIIFRRNFQDSRPYEREFEGIRHFDPISRSHPGLVPILHVGRDDEAGHYYYVMEPADDLESGQRINPAAYTPKTLARMVARHGPLPLDDCLRIGDSLTLALGYLHSQKLIHRDIKPSNIIFIKGHPKIADIGLVTDIGEGKTQIGTPGFIPVNGRGTPCADIYSLGKVLYELSTGLDCTKFPELPTLVLDRDRLKELARFNDIILKACEEDAQKRYQSAEQMHEDIVRLQGGGKLGR